MSNAVMASNGRTYIPGQGTNQPVPIEDRFWLHVDKSAGAAGCWAWTAQVKKPDGYGRIKVEGKMRTAHRVAMELTVGRALSIEECVCHRCDNPPCVNPSHLFIGTQLDNIRDMVAKGRAFSPRSTECPEGHSYLSDEHVGINIRGHQYCRTCSSAKRRAKRQAEAKA